MHLWFRAMFASSAWIRECPYIFIVDENYYSPTNFQNFMSNLELQKLHLKGQNLFAIGEMEKALDECLRHHITKNSTKYGQTVRRCGVTPSRYAAKRALFEQSHSHTCAEVTLSFWSLQTQTHCQSAALLHLCPSCLTQIKILVKTSLDDFLKRSEARNIDLLVGCDGKWSATRQTFMSPQLTSAGQYLQIRTDTFSENLNSSTAL